MTKTSAPPKAEASATKSPAASKPRRKVAPRDPELRVATGSQKYALVPHLVCAGAADAIAFYKKAFQAVETFRLPTKGGKLMHATLLICGVRVMLTDEFPEWGAFSPHSLSGTPVTLHLEVPDVDAFMARAVEAGATVKMAVADMFWGDRYGVIEDPFGHRWSISTHVRDVSAAEIHEAASRVMGDFSG